MRDDHDPAARPFLAWTGELKLPIVKTPGFGIKIEPVLEDPEHKAVRLEAKKVARERLEGHVDWLCERTQKGRDLLLKIAVAAKTKGWTDHGTDLLAFQVPFSAELLRELADEVNAPGPNGEANWR